MLRELLVKIDSNNTLWLEFIAGNKKIYFACNKQMGNVIFIDDKETIHNIN